MNKVKLSAGVFKALHDEILQKFEADFEKKGIEVDKKVHQKYGFTTSVDNVIDTSKPNLQKHIEQDDGFQEFCKEKGITKGYSNMGRYLYNKWLEVEKKGTEGINLNGKIYAIGLFRYLGYSDVNDYLNRSQQLKQSEYIETVKEQKQEIVKVIKDKSPFTAYIGYLCSTRLDSEEVHKSRGIVSFNLRIDYSKPQKNIDTSRGNKLIEYYAEMQINHDHYEDVFFIGAATICIGSLNIQLRSNSDKLYCFIFSVGISSPDRRRMMRGVYMRTSSIGGVRSSEVLLLRKDKLNDETLQKIKQYFHSNHYQIRIPSIFYPKDLKNPKDGDIKLIELIGNYYWLDKDTDGTLYVNKLVINKDLDSYCISGIFPTTSYTTFLQVHKSLLHIQVDKEIDLTLNRGLTILYAILQPHYIGSFRTPIFKGEEVYSGYRNKPIKERIVLIKSENDVPSEHIGQLNNETVKFLIKKDARFKDAFYYLLEMEESDKKRYAKVEVERQKYAELLK